MTQPDLATRHRERASRFAAVIDGVTDWDAPTPVREWSARDVVAHLTSWFPEFLAAGGVTIPVGDPRTPDVSWARQAAAVQALLDDPASAETTFAHPYVPPQSLAGAIDTFYSVDIFMHTWDLARASGQDDNLDEATCTELLTGMQSMADLIRGSGQFGEQQPVADDAPVQHRLLAFIGRDPHWRP
mgnify:CR=1 FL=1